MSDQQHGTNAILVLDTADSVANDVKCMLALQAVKVLHACYIQHASVRLQISMLVSSKASVLDSSYQITIRFEFLTKVSGVRCQAHFFALLSTAAGAPTCLVPASYSISCRTNVRWDLRQHGRRKR